MIDQDFYNIIDQELEQIIEKYKTDEYLRKNKTSKNNQKSYAFLI